MRARYVLVKAAKGLMPHEIVLGRRLRRRIGLRPGDVVEVSTPRKLLFWVKDGGGGAAARLSESVFRVMGISGECVLPLRKVSVSEAVFVELEASPGTGVAPRDLAVIRSQLFLAPYIVGSYLVCVTGNSGIMALKVRRARPRRGFITLNTSLYMA